MKSSLINTTKSGANDTWHFIDTAAADGVFNMAVDDALARFTKSSVPILRVYRWLPFTISIGYNQKIDEIDLDKCKKAGIDIVRRPTGGRAIFHAHEVTYSVIIPKETIWYKKNTLEIYNHISQALVKGLNKLGVPISLERKSKPEPDVPKYNQRFACFATSAKYEIQYNSKKLVGSAQRRYKNAVLQHGSIILGKEHLDLYNYLNSAGNGVLKDARKQLQEKTVCIESILNRNVAYEEVVQNLTTGFEEYFGVHVSYKHLTQQELLMIEAQIHNFSDLRRNFQ